MYVDLTTIGHVTYHIGLLFRACNLEHQCQTTRRGVVPVSGCGRVLPLITPCPRQALWYKCPLRVHISSFTCSFLSSFLLPFFLVCLSFHLSFFPSVIIYFILSISFFLSVASLLPCCLAYVWKAHRKNTASIRCFKSHLFCTVLSIAARGMVCLHLQDRWLCGH